MCVMFQWLVLGAMKETSDAQSLQLKLHIKVSGKANTFLHATCFLKQILNKERCPKDGTHGTPSWVESFACSSWCLFHTRIFRDPHSRDDQPILGHVMPNTI